ncbi:HAD family hydrolase [Streptomyces sp. JJ36]|uniref:HAD family hydrolase n=1 Tax=Streptomyces sp. JJ36 TaxID=2736645 RepID=UPI001F2BE985|nr:HAD family hydrolase [Streptomyces sp. JJ36]MCF6522844.1 HAD family hydrolase [Streptomyces sp. JJ36]
MTDSSGSSGSSGSSESPGAPEAVRAVLFDVDGTLVDTNYLHAVTWWEAFRQAGHRVPMRDVHHAVGMGSDRLVGHLLGPDRDREQDARIAAAHGTLYAAYFPKLAALPGAAALLRAVAARGRRVVLASSAAATELAAMRRALDADDAIDAATAGDDVDSTKPAPDLVREAVRLAGVPARRTLFVGDTVWDMQACAAAGVPCLGVLTGGVPRADLAEAGAEEVFDGPAELLERLDETRLAASLPTEDRPAPGRS